MNNMESYGAIEDGHRDYDDKQYSVSVPRGWNRILEKGAILYISPNKSRIRCKEDLVQYLILDGACKCGLECPFRIDDVFNFNPNIPSRLQENETVTSPHCVVSKKFSRFFPSESQRESHSLTDELEPNRKKKRRGQSKTTAFPTGILEDSNGIIQQGTRIASLPSKRPRKNPSRVPPAINSSSGMRYGQANNSNRYMMSSEMLEECTRQTESNSYEQNSVGVNRDANVYYSGSVQHTPSSQVSKTREMVHPSHNETNNETTDHSGSVAFSPDHSLYQRSGISNVTVPFTEVLDTRISRAKATTESSSNDVQVTNYSSEGFRYLPESSMISANMPENTTNVVSLGLASCVAMSVSASIESDVDRHAKSDSLPGNTLSVQRSESVDTHHPASPKTRAKNTNRKRSSNKGTEVKSKQSRSVKAKVSPEKDQLDQLQNIPVPGASLQWNSLPGGTVSAQFVSANATNFQSLTTMGKSLLQTFGCDQSVTDTNRQLQGMASNIYVPHRTHDSSLNDRTHVQPLQMGALGEEKMGLKRPSAMFKMDTDNTTQSAVKHSLAGIQSPNQNKHLETVNHSLDSQALSPHMNATGMGTEYMSKTCHDSRRNYVTGNMDTYQLTREKGPKVVGTPEASGSEAPPNITLSPSLSNSLLQKESDSRSLLPLSKVGSTISSTLETICVPTKQSVANISMDSSQLPLSDGVKSEKEAESKQQAKANVYWCSQGSPVEPSSQSPTVNTTVASQLPITSKDTASQITETQSTGVTKSRGKPQIVNRHALSSPTSCATPQISRTHSVEQPGTLSDTQVTTGHQPTASTHHVQPNMPLLTLPSTCMGTTTASQREFLNAPLPINSQSQSVKGQNTAYMLQGQDPGCVSTVGQPMVLLRFVSQSSSNTKVSSSFTSPTSAQAHVLPSSYGIPVSQSVYHSQLTNYAVPNAPNNSGQVFIMGNTHASQALQNLALQNNQTTKDDGVGSLVYQTGYSTHGIRSQAASLNYAGIPLQLMTISGSPVVARPQGQVGNKGDTYAAMLQYYQKQMDLSRVRGGHVLAPAPSLIRPLTTQVSPAFGNSYIRIAPAFGAVAGKDTHSQPKLARNANDLQQTSSSSWSSSNDKGKTSISSSIPYVQDTQQNTATANSSKESRNANSPLSPKFEFSRLKHNTHLKPQTSQDTKLGITSANTSQVSVSATHSYSLSSFTSEENIQMHRTTAETNTTSVTKPGNPDPSSSISSVYFFQSKLDFSDPTLSGASLSSGHNSSFASDIDTKDCNPPGPVFLEEGQKVHYRDSVQTSGKGRKPLKSPECQGSGIIHNFRGNLQCDLKKEVTDVTLRNTNSIVNTSFPMSFTGIRKSEEIYSNADNQRENSLRLVGKHDNSLKETSESYQNRPILSQPNRVKTDYESKTLTGHRHTSDTGPGILEGRLQTTFVNASSQDVNMQDAQGLTNEIELPIRDTSRSPSAKRKSPVTGKSLKGDANILVRDTEEKSHQRLSGLDSGTEHTQGTGDEIIPRATCDPLNTIVSIL